MNELPFLKPNIVPKESYIHYLEQIDASGIYSNFGTLNTLFEKRILQEYFQDQGAGLTVNNATTGLMLALSHSERPQGKYALMPSFTFSATPLAAMWCGLTPYFIDVREHDWCMDEEMLEQEIQRLGDDVAVVVPYATFGTYLDLEYYRALHNRQIPVVIDAAASFGTSLDHQFGQNFKGILVYSFHTTKAFGIGEGGFVYSDDQDTIQQLRQAANFGFDQVKDTHRLGLNEKLSEYAAAIGLATLDVFPQKKKTREQIMHWYREGIHHFQLRKQGWRFQEVKGSVPHQFMSVLCPEKYTNKDYVRRLQQQGIQVRTYFSPACHQQKLFRFHPQSTLAMTENIAKRILSLPVWEEMNPEHVAHVLQNIVHK